LHRRPSRKLLDRVFGSGPAGIRGLAFEGGHRRQAGLGARLHVDAIDREAQAVGQLAAEGPGEDGDVVVGKSDCLQARPPMRGRRANALAAIVQLFRD
jgi:hypothetical protein